MTIRGFRILITLLTPGKICQAAFACAFVLLSVMASMASARPQSLQALPDQPSSVPGVPFEKLADVIVRNCARCHFKGSPAARAIALDELHFLTFAFREGRNRMAESLFEGCRFPIDAPARLRHRFV